MSKKELVIDGIRVSEVKRVLSCLHKDSTLFLQFTNTDTVYIGSQFFVFSVSGYHYNEIFRDSFSGLPYAGNEGKNYILRAKAKYPEDNGTGINFEAIVSKADSAIAAIATDFYLKDCQRVIVSADGWNLYNEVYTGMFSDKVNFRMDGYMLFSRNAEFKFALCGISKREMSGLEIRVCDEMQAAYIINSRNKVPAA